MHAARRHLLALGLATGLGLAGSAVAPVGVLAATPSAARDVFRAEVGGLSTTAFASGSYLTGPSKQPASRVVLDYLRDHRESFGLSAAAVKALSVRKDVVTAHDGAHHLVLGQDVEGIPVNGAVVTALVDSKGRLILVGGPTAEVSTSGSVALSAGEAIAVAARRGGATKAQAPESSSTKAKGKHTFSNPYRKGAGLPVTAELVWHLQADRSLRLAWRTDVDVASNAWFGSVVDAETGKVLQHESRYDHAGPEGNVIREEDPDVSPGGQQITPFTGIDGSWVTGTTTSGNNVNAYMDRNDDDLNNEYQPTAADQHFNYTFNDSWSTTSSVTSQAALDTDRDATITQMFYYTNDLHDWLYNHGFNEASGNFQVNNFGRGGTGNDAVQAEAQDGWAFGCDDGVAPTNQLADRCLNNANFGTNGDGTAARMQMFLWTQPPFGWRDGTMDGSLIAHEYGHGVSNRLVPGTLSGATDQAGSLGEGWSDVIAFLRWGDATFARYSSADTTGGLRTSNYDVHPDTYGDYSTGVGSPHRNGEIWAATLYDLRVALGLNAATIRLVLDGMRSTTGPSPTFLNARDGILAANQATNGTANRCEIWSVFAKRGMGVSAVSNGLHAVPTEDFTIPVECRPTANAGGDYNTNEGTDVSLSGSGAKGSDPSAGNIATYEWDLDNDGEYDDATGQTPSFTDVGQDGSFTVGLRVTDEFGNTATDTALVNVANVTPTVSINAITPINEHGTATVSGTITDPGWEDTLSATVDFDDGAGPVLLNGSMENVRPDATFTFSVDKQYGDNGTFAVKVTGADDDSSGSDTENAAVANLDPTSTIDGSGEQVYDGQSAFVLEAGEDLTVPASASDLGSDDLDFSWIWGDGTTSTQTSQVNPPADDPAKSPSVQPRENITLQATHGYVDACLYELKVKVDDDDGGTASDTAAVIITGNADISKGHGYWLNQYRVKSGNDFTPAELQCYLDIVGFFSLVFNEKRDADSRADATKVLNAPAKAPEAIIFDQHALGAWLNFANGSVKLDTMVDTNLDGVDDATFGAVMLAAETVRVNPASTSAEIKAQKDIINRIITQSE